MSFTIPEKVINETSMCEYHFSCLKPGQLQDNPICSVDYADGHNVLFLKKDESRPCPYQVPFGYGMVCTCPTHFAIHKIFVNQRLLPPENE